MIIFIMCGFRLFFMRGDWFILERRFWWLWNLMMGLYFDLLEDEGK